MAKVVKSSLVFINIIVTVLAPQAGQVEAGSMKGLRSQRAWRKKLISAVIGKFSLQLNADHKPEHIDTAIEAKDEAKEEHGARCAHNHNRLFLGPLWPECYFYCFISTKYEKSETIF